MDNTRIWDLARFTDRIALLDEAGDSLTYQKLKEEGGKVADAAGGRCLAFLLARNSIGSVIGYTGFLNAGIVPAMLSEHLDPELLENLLEVYRPSVVWLPAQRAEVLLSCFPGWVRRYEAYDYVLLKAPDAVGDSDSDDQGLYEELALLLTTSGSTGSPKFVRQSYENIKSNAESICSYLQLDENERPITTLPMNYTYGLSIINSHLLVGATILLTDKGLMQKDFWSFFKEQRATSFGGVPYTYEMLDKLRFWKMDLPSLRTMTQAGGKLLPSLHEKFALYARENGKQFVVMYGQCEATARMAYLPPDKAVEKKGSMGIAIPGGHFDLIDENGEVIREPDTTGELVYEGENVTLGYAQRREDLAKGDERGGRLETGDLARFDADGYYYIVGRKKRFLKIYGNRVNLDEIERMIKDGFGAEAAVCGSDDHMILVLTDESISDQVKAYVSGKTGLNVAAFTVKVLQTLPKNEAGKILYKQLEEIVGDGNLK